MPPLTFPLLLVCAGVMLNMTTETVASYQQYLVTVADVDHLVLGIKACHDAHVLFAETVEHNDNVYEVRALQ